MSAQPQELWQLHPLQESHLAQVLEIERCAYVFPWTEGIFRDCLKAGYPSWVVVDAAGDVLAYMLTTMAVGEVHLLNLCVAPEHQGQGLARFLMSQLLRRAQQAHMTEILLEVRRSNKAAIALYESCGFERLGVRKSYYPAHEGREDAIVFGRQVT